MMAGLGSPITLSSSPNRIHNNLNTKDETKLWNQLVQDDTTSFMVGEDGQIINLDPAN